MMRNRMLSVLVFVLLIAAAVAGRLMPHVPNFTPLAAVTLFAGVWYARRGTALLVPLGAMLASDAILGGYDWRLMAVVYVAMMLPVGLRGLLRTRLSAWRVAGAAAGSSVAFYLATNFAHWMWMPGYERSLSGLTACYLAALPFFKYQLAGDLAFSAVLFGAYALLTQRSSAESVAQPALTA